MFELKLNHLAECTGKRTQGRALIGQLHPTTSYCRKAKLTRTPSFILVADLFTNEMSPDSPRGGWTEALRRRTSEPFVPDGNMCNRQEQQLRVLRRRASAPQAHGSQDDDDAGPVDLGKLAVCTTVYSLVEGIVTYPYDLVKTRQQVAPPGSRVTQLPTTAYVHEIIQTQGAKSLYRGFSWNVLGGVPSEVAYYATYTWSKHTMQQTKLGQEYPSAVFACAGLLSDVVGVLFWVPADVISQRMQLQGVVGHGENVVGCSERIAAVAGTPSAPAAAVAASPPISSISDFSVTPSPSRPLGASPHSSPSCNGSSNWLAALRYSWERTVQLTAEAAFGAAEAAFAAAGPSATSSPAAASAATHESSTRSTRPRAWTRTPRRSWLQKAGSRDDAAAHAASRRPSAISAAAASAAAASSASSSTATSPAVSEVPLSGVQLAQRIVRSEGIVGLWRGTAATMLSLAPNSAVWWLTHEECKPRLARKLDVSEESAFLLSASGALAGFTSTLATNPLDVVKTRLQCSENAVGLSLHSVLQGVLREAGWRGLYHGLIPRIAAAIPRSVCAVLFYEQSIALCRRTPATSSDASC